MRQETMMMKTKITLPARTRTMVLRMVMRMLRGRGLCLEDKEMPAHTIVRMKTAPEADLMRPLPMTETCESITAVPSRGTMEAILTTAMRVPMNMPGKEIETQGGISEEATTEQFGVAAPALASEAAVDVAAVDDVDLAQNWTSTPW
jgi:hypothetical protein